VAAGANEVPQPVQKFEEEGLLEPHEGQNKRNHLPMALTDVDHRNYQLGVE
jgi:hypothetical protein